MYCPNSSDKAKELGSGPFENLTSWPTTEIPASFLVPFSQAEAPQTDPKYHGIEYRPIKWQSLDTEFRTCGDDTLL